MQLQKPASALLGALDLKQLGTSPTQFSETVFGCIDLLDHYLLNQQAIGAADGNVTNANDSLTITVPAAEVWRVHAVSYTQTIAVGDTTLLGRIAYLPSAGGSVRCALQQLDAVGGRAGSITITKTFDRPLLARQGSAIQFILDAALAAARAGALRTLHEVITV